MSSPDPQTLAELRAIAPGAIRSSVWQAAGLILLALLVAAFSTNLTLTIGIAIAWMAACWLFDRWRIGPDYKTIQRAEFELLRKQGRGSFFLGYAWALIAYLFWELVHEGETAFNIGTAILLAIALGTLCRAGGLWLKLRQHLAAIS
jgi:hypothetical protein